MLIIRSKYRSTILIYTSGHLFSICLLLLRHIDDARICICPGRDEIRSSSILDHFPYEYLVLLNPQD
jgi:hypothetical protein